MKMDRLLEIEEQARNDFREQVMELILKKYVDGDGYAARGPLQTCIYNQLGFKGRSGNGFARFINRLLAERGYRIGWYGGHRVVFGLTLPA